jgi:phosphomannomutase
MYICDETGVMFSGTVTTAIIASIFLQRHKGEKVIYNAVCGDMVPETIHMNGGVPLIEKVGHVYIKEAMSKDLSICFGGEHSGHYYFRENNNADSGAIAFMTVFASICTSGKKTSELRKAFERYPQISETNFAVTDTSAMIFSLKEKYQDGEYTELDGLTIRYPDYWFNVRPSSNEPLLRLNLEAKSEEILQEKFAELQGFFRGSVSA